MKKKIVAIITILLFLISNQVYAKTMDITKYKTQTIEEVFKEEGIDYDLSNYQENDNQVTIYLFRGSGCGYCANFLNYVSTTLIPKYGEYFKIVSFEIWNDQNNHNLLNEVSTFLEQPAQGVPYIIIGNQVFPGYGEDYNSGIEQAIKDLYNSDNRYDVFNEMSKEKDSEGNNTSSTIIILWNLIFIATSTFIILGFISSKFKTLNDKLNKK